MILNRGHPLTRGLIGAWPLVNGQTVKDLCGKFPMTPMNGPTAVNGRAGKGTRYTAASSQAHRTTGLVNYPTWPMTVSYIGRFINVNSTQYFGGRHEPMTGLPLGWEFRREAAFAYQFGANIFSDNQYYDQIAAPVAAITSLWNSTKTWHFVFSNPTGRIDVAEVLVKELGSGQVLRCNPGSWTRVGASGFYPQFTIGGELTVGARGATANTPADIEIYDIRLWNRVLTEQEMLDVLESPWAMYSQRGMVVGSTPEESVRIPRRTASRFSSRRGW